MHCLKHITQPPISVYYSVICAPKCLKNIHIFVLPPHPPAQVKADFFLITISCSNYCCKNKAYVILIILNLRILNSIIEVIVSDLILYRGDR
uniref:Uncharacterized protein n=1 Tax=Anguilla anguilla TaxID=7936 RepID=A0A0E9X4X0_ANGAN